jgi:hypothetical protein
MKKKVVVKFAVAAYDRGTGLFEDNLVASRQAFSVSAALTA